MSRIGMLVALLLLLLGPLFLTAAWLYPKAGNGHYRLETRVGLETRALRKIFRGIGWGCLLVGLLLYLGFSIMVD